MVSPAFGVLALGLFVLLLISDFLNWIYTVMNIANENLLFGPTQNELEMREPNQKRKKDNKESRLCGIVSD